MECLHDSALVDPQEFALNHRGRGGHALLLAAHAPLTEKFLLSENGKHSFFSLFGNDSEFHFAFLNKKYRIGSVALREYTLAAFVRCHGSAVADFVQEVLQSE